MLSNPAEIDMIALVYLPAYRAKLSNITTDL